MIPDRSQYFFDDSGNFQNFENFGTRTGPWNPLFVMNLLQKIQGKILEHPWKIWILDISTFWNSKISTFFGPLNPPYFLYHISGIAPKKSHHRSGFLVFFG